MSGEEFTKQVWEDDCNVTPTPKGYCDFFDQFGAHAYMGGVPVRGEYRDDWSTCCGIDCPGGDVAWEAAEADNARLVGVIERLEIEKHDLTERLVVATTLLRLEGRAPHDSP